MSSTVPFDYIDSADALSRLCDRLADAPWIAIDTEFLREKTYYPKLCLLQLAVPGTAACIDPLALDDFAPLTDPRSTRRLRRRCSAIPTRSATATWSSPS